MRHPSASSRHLVPTLALLTTVTAVVSSLGAPLVPSVATEYDVPLTTAQLSLTAPLLVGATSTPVVGRFASGALRRPGILVGLAVVVAGALLAALSTSVTSGPGLGFGLLVTGRALQGVGMALLPLAVSIARDELAGVRMTRAIALLSVTTVAGAGLGYPATALLAELGGLPAAHLLGATLTSVTLAMAWVNLPPSSTPPAARVDWSGAALLTTGVLAVLLAVSQGGVWEWTSARTLGLSLTGLAVIVAWAVRTLAHPTPLVDLRLATRPGVAAPNLVALVAGVGMYGVLTLSVIVVRADPRSEGFGLAHSVIVAGLILVPYSIASVAGNRLALRAAQHLGTRRLLPIGCVLFLLSTLWLSLLHDHLWQVLVAMALGGAGSGFTFSSLAVLMVPHLPQAETAPALAFNQVLRYLGFTVGSAVTPTLIGLFGGGAAGFRSAAGSLCLLWVAAVVGVMVLDRPSPATPA